MKSDFRLKDKYGLEDVVDIVRLLRDPDCGCPWDKEQTHESIRKNLLEEAYEACDAIDKSDKALLREELGDVLLQVAMHSEIERQSGGFDISDVADELCKKLILRHPHIFGDVNAGSSAEVLDNWEAIKRREKGQRAGSDAIDDVPLAFPALYRCQKVQKRAKDAGFDYQSAGQAVCDLESEVAEFKRALAGEGDPEEEIGDVIFAAVNAARLSGLDAESSAAKACEKFIRRFKIVESTALKRGFDIKSCSPQVLDELWSEAKTNETNLKGEEL